MEREERQKQAESEQPKQRRRYEDLERDGMEDNAELVDASATLDRDWDDWKNENPRGSGNMSTPCAAIRISSTIE
jgi:immunoglobulin-binding protein 1